MAESAKKPVKTENLPQLAGKLTPVQMAAATMMGQGLKTPEIARRLVDYIIQNSRGTKASRLKQARSRVRKWARSQEFRDVVWNISVAQLDLETPQILRGVAKKAKAGRVDAARLTLEVTNRHNPKGDAVPTQIAVVFEGVPRPKRHHSKEVVEAEVVEEDEDE